MEKNGIVSDKMRIAHGGEKQKGFFAQILLNKSSKMCLSRNIIA